MDIATSNSGHVVRAHGLGRRFDQTVALTDVSFAVEPGEVVALLGHNGAGKTTLLRLVNGLLRPTSGTVETLGIDPVRHGQAVRSATGVLTEDPALDDFLTPGENLSTFGRMYGLVGNDLAVRVNGLLERLELTAKRDVHCRHLSAGLRQRVALARAMLHEPDLLLLDEPTSNLDPLAARTVRQLVLEQSRIRGTTVMVSTHNLAEAAAIADRVVVLRMGRVMAFGAIDQLANQSPASITITLADPRCRDDATLVLSQHGSTVQHHATAGQFSAATDVVGADEVLALLIGRGIGVVAAVPNTPSLEDIYVALHDDQPQPRIDGHTVADGSRRREVSHG